MKLIFLIFSLFLIVFNFNAQPPCGSNPPAGETCATATPICELNGYCGNTYSYSPNAWGSTGSIIGCGFLGLSACPGTGLLNVFCGSVENDSYLTFVASSSTISFNVWVTSSVYGDGIQLIVFSTPSCGSNTVTSYYCNQITPSGSTAVSVSGLTAGNTYYIMIDGFAGDLCDYVIGANSGISIPVDITPLTSSICPGETVNLAASGGNGTFTWNATPQLNTTTGANVVATPPSVPGTYTYTVNSATGNPLCPSSTTATATITVNNCGCTVNASNSGDVCPGGTVDLFASNVANATYAWSGPSGYSSTSQNPTGIVMPTTPGTYTYTVTATVSGVPCTSTTTVTVNALPTVSAGSYSPVCSDITTVALAGTPSGGTFSGTGVTGTNFNTSSGTQVVTYSYTDVNSCSNTATATITVNSQPSVSAGIYTSVCSDAADISLSGTPSGGTFSGTGVTGANFDPSAGTQLITYNYTDPSGCSGIGTTTITVNSLPVVDAGVYAAVCSNGSNVALVGTPVGGTFSGTGVTGTSFNPTSGTQTVTYSYTNGNGCTSSDVATITVNPAPVVNAGTYSPVCVNGTPVNLVGTPAGGTFSGTGVTANTFNPASGTQTITYSYTTPQNCTNSSTAIIQVNNLPSINGGSDVTVCVGSSVTLSGAGGTTYAWNNGGINGQSFTPSTGSTVYTVTGTDANGCVNTDNVNVNVMPYPSASANADVTSGNPGLVVNFDNFSTNSTSYNWNFGNGASATVTNLNSQVTTYNTVGSYMMVLTASNGLCSDTAMIQIDILPFPSPDIYVPNVFTPNGDNANDDFFITVHNASAIEMIILNRWGNVVHEITTLDGVWDGDVNGKHADDGVYFFKYTVTGINGEEITGHGNVTLLRN